MAGALTHVYDDAEQFAAALTPGRVQITLTQRGQFSAVLTALALDRLVLRRSVEKLPRIAWVELAPAREDFTFLAGPSHGVFGAGAELQRNSIVWHEAGQAYYQRTLGQAALASLSFPAGGLAGLQAMSGWDGTRPALATTVLPSAQAMQRLLRLHAVAGQLAAGAPEVLSQPGAAYGLEQALMEALGDCLDGTRIYQTTDCVSQRRHEEIMRRFAGALWGSADHNLFLPEICAEIGVSARTLRACCHEHLGLGPKHFLMLRRMNMVRQALAAADSATVTVTTLATEFGFWELGRFAGTYRDLFGETPSATLRRDPAPICDEIFDSDDLFDGAADERSSRAHRWIAAIGQAMDHGAWRDLAVSAPL